MQNEIEMCIYENRTGIVVQSTNTKFDFSTSVSMLLIFIRVSTMLPPPPCAHIIFVS